MARILINDLEFDKELNTEEMQDILGGRRRRRHHHRRHRRRRRRRRPYHHRRHRRLVGWRIVIYRRRVPIYRYV